jgi:hypothetical protein
VVHEDGAHECYWVLLFAAAVTAAVASGETIPTVPTGEGGAGGGTTHTSKNDL